MAQPVALDKYHLQATCERCGFVWTFRVEYQRRNYETTLCKSCTAKPSSKARSRIMPTLCVPHVGEFDLDTNQPLDDAGEPFMPGHRRCGHADCVNRNHIMSNRDLEAERFDLSYLTGRKLTTDGFFAAIKKEKMNV